MITTTIGEAMCGVLIPVLVRVISEIALLPIEWYVPIVEDANEYIVILSIALIIRAIDTQLVTITVISLPVAGIGCSSV